MASLADFSRGLPAATSFSSPGYACESRSPKCVRPSAPTRFLTWNSKSNRRSQLSASSSFRAENVKSSTQSRGACQRKKSGHEDLNDTHLEAKVECHYRGSGSLSSRIVSFRSGDSICSKSAGVVLGFTPAASGVSGRGRRGTRCWEVQIVNCSRMSKAEIIPPSGISKNVSVLNLDGEKLAGILDDTGSKEICILCHGFRSSKRSTTLGVVASTLVTAGFSTFRFDFSGNGESEGEFAYGNYWKEVEDLRAVIQYWRNEGRQITAIIGHSKGGNAVLLYTSKYGDVKTVVNVSGRFDLAVGTQARFGEVGMRKLEQDGFLDVKDRDGGYRVTLKSLQDRLSTDMDGAAKSIPKDCRVLTLHGSEDEVVKVEDAYFFAERIVNHVLRIFDGANHNYEGQREQLAAVVLNFVQGNVSKI